MSAVESAVEQRVLNALGAAEPAQANHNVRSERPEPAANPDTPEVERSGTEQEMEERVLNALGRELEPKDAPKPAPEAAKATEAPRESNAQPDEVVYTQSEVDGMNRHNEAVRQYNAELQQFTATAAQVERWPEGEQKSQFRLRLHVASQQLRERHKAINNLRQSLDRSIYSRKAERGRQTIQSAFPDLDDNALRAYVKETFGVDDRAIDDPRIDPRALITLEKSRRYDEMMKNGQTSRPSASTQRIASPNAARLTQNQQLEQRVGSVFTKGKASVVGQRMSNQAYQQKLGEAKTSVSKAKVIERHLANRFG